MILKALYDYYNRCGDLAPTGMEYKEIAFLIVIDEEGNFIRLEDRRIDTKSCQKFLVVKGMRSGTTPKPYLYWDNVEYVCNYTKLHAPLNEADATNPKKIEERDNAIKKAQEKHSALIEKYRQTAHNNPTNECLQAVSSFYAKGELTKVYEDPLWTDIAKKPTVNLSFLVNGRYRIVAEEDCLHPKQAEEEKKNNAQAHLPICLITGRRGEVVESTTPTPIADSQATARLVAFQVNSGYDSYGKSKGHNATISKEAEAQYTTALNRLLDKQSKNKFVIANRTFVFWASSASEGAKASEEALYALFGLSTEEADDPNARIELVRQTFSAIYSGKIPAESDDRFYFLGLTPNAARIAVCYWAESSLKDFSKNILRHFEDMQIVDTRKKKTPYMGLHSMMGAVTLKGKSSEVQPNLPEAVMKSILQGLPYPYVLLLACINRIRAEQAVTTGRAAIIKAYLNRLKNNSIKYNVMIDKDNQNQGYLCGRLFATLEYLQERSNNGNSTIRSRYMNAASATPATVFPTLLNLSVHHTDKLAKNSQVFFEQIKSEILDKIPSEGFAAHLDLNDQGRFMVGYYHQRQCLEDE